MKFLNPNDKVKFLVDVGRIDLVDKEIPEPVFEEAAKKRGLLIKKMVDKKKANIKTQDWKKNRYAFLKGIRDHAKSQKGKKAHRAVASLVSGRITTTRDRLSTKSSLTNYTTKSTRQVGEQLKAISSMRTHIYINFDYYRPIRESVDLCLWVDYAVPILWEVEKKIFEGNQDISNEEFELLVRLLDLEELDASLKETQPPFSFQEVDDDTPDDIWSGSFFWTELVNEKFI